MTPTDKKPTDSGPIDEGVSAAAWAVGRAVGFVRRLVPSGKDGDAPADQPVRRSKRGRPKKQKKQNNQGQVARRDGQPALEHEVSRLEDELDQIYGAIAAGAGDQRNRGTSAAQLEDLIGRAKELKELLRTKRTDLARIERDSARQRQLQRRSAFEAAAPQAEPARKKEPRAKRADSRQAPAPPDAGAALKRALAKAPFEDDAQRLVMERLAASLADPDAEVRRSAATKLGESGLPGAAGLLELVAGDPSEKVRIAVFNALARAAEPAAAELLFRHVRDPNTHLRLASLRGLAKLHDERATRLLIEALEDEETGIRKTAATLLGWGEAREAVRPLILGLRDPEASVRAAAAASLGGLRDDRAVLSLIRTLGDAEASVRKASKRSVETILGQTIEFDAKADAGAEPSRQIEALRAWWKEARVTAQIERIGGPGLPDEVLELKPPSEPRAAASLGAVTRAEDAAPPEPEPEPEPAKTTEREPEQEATAGVVEPGAEAAVEPAAEPKAEEEAAATGPEYESLLDDAFGGDEAEEPDKADEPDEADEPDKGEEEEYESLL